MQLQVSDMIKEVDGLIDLLVKGLKKKNIYNCVNLIVLSDHGMATGGQKLCS